MANESGTQKYMNPQWFWNKKVFVFPMILTDFQKVYVFWNQAFLEIHPKRNFGFVGYLHKCDDLYTEFMVAGRGKSFLCFVTFWNLVALHSFEILPRILPKSWLCFGLISLKFESQKSQLGKCKSVCISNDFERFSKRITF